MSRRPPIGMVTKAAKQTLSNKTIASPTFSGTASGSLTSLTLVTPALGTPASGVITSCTGSPTLTAPALGTPASGVLTNCTGLPQAGLASSAVGQAQLKTTTGEVSTSAGAVNATLPGGTYGFYPQVKFTAGGTSTSMNAQIALVVSGTSYVTNIRLATDDGGGGTASAQHRYVQASPPYNLGNGDVPLFMFALVDSLGKIRATYVAPEPPWAYNGPTDIRADYYRDGKCFQKPRLNAQQRLDLRDPEKRDAVLTALAVAEDAEITHAIKNEDMPLIPHPFIANALTGLTVVLLDAVCAFGDQMATLHNAGASVCELLYGGAVSIDNTPLDALTPQGVISCSASWK